MPDGEIAHDFFRSAADRHDLDLAVEALDRIAAQIAGPAENLHRLAGAIFEILGGAELGLANLRDRHFALVGEPANLVQPAIEPVHPRRHLGNLVADHLMSDHRLAKGLALLRIVDRIFEQYPHHAE